MQVISLFLHPSRAALDNHRHYAALHGYRHIVIDAADIYRNAPAQWLFKYESLLSEMHRAEEGEIVLLLSENAAIVEPVPLDFVLGERDWLLTRIKDVRPQPDVQIWRNTARVRAELLKVVNRCRFGSPIPPIETDLLDAFDACTFPRVCGNARNPIYAVLAASGPLMPVWPRFRVFALAIAEEHADLSRTCVHPRLREALIEHLNAHRNNHARAFEDGASDESTMTAMSTCNPGRPVSITTVYTPEAAIYGRIAEANLREYCERHGYTLYVHREVPRRIAERLPMRGNWVKPFLLRENLPHHEWAFWLDADTLVNDLDRPLESFCSSRDLVLARDVGTWIFNSGVMGFRRTPANAALLDRVIASVENVDDKQSLVSGGGDQWHFNCAVSEQASLGSEDICSLVDINTPWGFRVPSSFLVHYHGMSPQMRALLMSYDLRLRRAEMEHAGMAVGDSVGMK
ncbi:galactosyl transferase GMA12/MNN10 domain protein [Caballeronia sp. ATUFL_F2_KS9A]|jgi:hypothetical protein|uniref:galactosyl transferase GMA12/MNN10 domain protein n=1 Tax=Caballeronia sp. ATUFL_F2_KS9A TaxID=2921777 RepID=UPI0020286901|nr:galactosyl transferase GMA12/MNN10 domain protein [Caballeronia sp. ATUFL_F2_KS9A]